MRHELAFDSKRPPYEVKGLVGLGDKPLKKQDDKTTRITPYGVVSDAVNFISEVHG